MATPFILPESNTGKPEVPKWIPPEPTEMVLEWVTIFTILTFVKLAMTTI